MTDELIEFKGLEIVTKNGKQFLKIKKKDEPPKSVDDTLPQDVRDMLGNNNDI